MPFHVRPPEVGALAFIALLSSAMLRAGVTGGLANGGTCQRSESAGGRAPTRDRKPEGR